MTPHSPTPSPPHSPPPPLPLSLTPSLPHPLTPSLPHSLTPSLPHSLTPSLPHSHQIQDHGDSSFAPPGPIANLRQTEYIERSRCHSYPGLMTGGPFQAILRPFTRGRDAIGLAPEDRLTSSNMCGSVNAAVGGYF